ncbi:hypothetical protein MRX96_059639 [Rhipicephalus microplus]|uniref:Uncharacterized protein n=1 Tax=Rhipicephalus microplus TaxID=6941 RepID=A0A9J6EYM4_RHIMP|nr:hypothetical protein HPB51_006421 [Rhipicephalus microplus]
MIKNVFPHTWDYINCLYRTPILTGVSAVSAGVGLGTDFMLLQAVKFGAVKPRTATPDPVPPGVALFLIYDFYEGVKQQGTLLASGLVDSLPEREIGSSPKQVVPIDEHGEAVGDALLEESPENHALPSGDTIDSRTTDKSMNPA